MFGAVPWLALSLAEGLGSSIFWLWLRRLGGGNPVRLALFAPPIWIFYEYFRTLGDIAFPWSNIAHPTAVWLPFIQVASILGIYGCIAVILFANASIFLLLFLTYALLKKIWQKIPSSEKFLLVVYPILGTLIFVGNLAYGTYRQLPVESDYNVRIGVAQLKYQASLKPGDEQTELWMAEYGPLLERAKAEGVELLVLPESFLEIPDFKGSPLESIVQFWLYKSKMSVLYGASWLELTETEDVEVKEAYVSYHLMDAKKRRGRVDKARIVPFGEYVPLRPVLTRIFPYPWNVQDFQRGKARKPIWWNNHRLGVLICFETLFPQDARMWAIRDVELLVSGTNSSWFGKSPATEQMAKFEAFRAVETGLFFVRAGTGGVSSIIHPSGKFLAWIPQFVSDITSLKIPFLRSRTLYTRLGDWLPWFCIALFLPFYLEALRRKSG